MINRRQFLLGTAAAATGVAGAVVIAATDPFHDTPPAAAADGERFTHRGRLVVILPPLGAMLHAMVNGNRQVHLERFGGEYLTHLLPFGTFRRPRQLMEAVIDAEDDGLLVI